MSITVSPRREIETAPIGTFHWKFGLLVGLVMFFDGYDLFNAAYVVPFLKQEWGLHPTQIGTLLSSGIAGLSLGSLVQGWISDKFGRRVTMLIALFALSFASILLAAAAHGFTSFLVFRILLGTALGMVTPLTITYVNEWAPKKYENTFAIWVFLIGFCIGGVMASLVGVFATPTLGWRSIYYFGSASMLVAIAAYVWLPESVAFLWNKGKHVELARVLTRVRPDRSEFYKGANFEYVSASKAKNVFTTLFQPRYIRNTLVCWVSGALSLFCIHGITSWLPSVLIRSGHGIKSSFIYGSAMMLSSLVGGLTSGWFADKYSSRTKTMFVWYLAAAVAIAALSMSLSDLVLPLLIVASGFFVFGAQSVLNNFIAMSYDSDVRSTGVGVAVAVNRVGGICGPFVIGLLQNRGNGVEATFIALSIASLLAAAVVMAGRPLAEVPKDTRAAALPSD